jgi:hypothetical protein
MVETSTTLKLASLTNIPCHRDAAAARFWQLVNKASSHYVPPVSLSTAVGSIGAGSKLSDNWRKRFTHPILGF